MAISPNIQRQVLEIGFSAFLLQILRVGGAALLSAVTHDNWLSRPLLKAELSWTKVWRFTVDSHMVSQLRDSEFERQVFVLLHFPCLLTVMVPPPNLNLVLLSSSLEWSIILTLHKLQKVKTQSSSNLSALLLSLLSNTPEDHPVIPAHLYKRTTWVFVWSWSLFWS